jgi:sugar lactone lactonase YvrE
MVLSVDGSELIVGETFGGRYSAYAIGTDGHLGPRRTWAQLGDSPPPGPLSQMRQALTFTPDGCCLDADGRIWSADPKGRRLVLLEEGGRVVEEVPAPDGRAFIACMLGGERGRTLLASVVPSPHDYVSRHGALFTIEVDVPHGGRP